MQEASTWGPLLACCAVLLSHQASHLPRPPQPCRPPNQRGSSRLPPPAGADCWPGAGGPAGRRRRAAAVQAEGKMRRLWWRMRELPAWRHSTHSR